MTWAAASQTLNVVLLMTNLGVAPACSVTTLIELAGGEGITRAQRQK